MKEKQRTHLNPEEVQEFIDLGVDFGETTIMWAIDEDNYAFLFPRISHICRMKSWQMLPCPNLQDVLGLLPPYIINIVGADHYKACLNFHKYVFQGFSYCYCPVRGRKVTLIEECDDNPLIAAVNLLRWVCKNHPETLTKTE